jgi:hypothetical protein
MKYMPQDVFDGCALTVAMAGFSGVDMANIASQLANDYQKLYNDAGLTEQILEASNLLLEAVPHFFETEQTDRQLAASCKVLSSAIQKFNVDGSKRRKGLLGGTIFNKEKSEIEDKPQKCLSNVIAYNIAIFSGVIDPRKI